jgi:hypothetical protein
MRFFSHEWSTIDDIEADLVFIQYKNLVSTISNTYKLPITRFVEECDLRGALVDMFSILSIRNTLRLDLIAGDVQSGYFLLSILYSGSSFDYIGEDLAATLDSRTTRVRFDEFDLDNKGVPHHRLLMWPRDRGEIDIQFSGIEWSKRMLPDRCYQNFGEVFQCR